MPEPEGEPAGSPPPPRISVPRSVEADCSTRPPSAAGASSPSTPWGAPARTSTPSTSIRWPTATPAPTST
ncbi:hypothetical protein NQP46_25550 [Streptomyces albus]|nr:hypothetical protein NQP46_25550 [Streptomyces albus]